MRTAETVGHGGSFLLRPLLSMYYVGIVRVNMQSLGHPGLFPVLQGHAEPRKHQQVRAGVVDRHQSEALFIASGSVGPGPRGWSVVGQWLEPSRQC